MIIKLISRTSLSFLILLTLFLIITAFTAFLRESDALGTLPGQGGRLVTTDFGQVYVLERGPTDGTPVLLTHGTAAWSGLWLPTLGTLGEQSYRAIAFDMPPFGYSQHPADHDYSRQAQAKRFLALLTALKIKPIVVAHSFSGGMVAEAAMIDPSQLAGLVFVDAAIGLNSHIDPKFLPTVLKPRLVRRAAVAATVSNPMLTGPFLRSFIHVKSEATEPIIKVLRQPMSREGYTDAVTEWLPQLFQSPVEALSTRPEKWQSLDLPVAFIWGDKDTITPLSQAKELSALVPQATLTVLRGIGHIPQVEAPEVLQKSLVRVLKDLSAQQDNGVTQ